MPPRILFASDEWLFRNTELINGNTHSRPYLSVMTFAIKCTRLCAECSFLMHKISAYQVLCKHTSSPWRQYTTALHARILTRFIPVSKYCASKLISIFSAVQPFIAGPIWQYFISSLSRKSLSCEQMNIWPTWERCGEGREDGTVDEVLT